VKQRGAREDANGKNILHYACRALEVDIVDHALSLDDECADMVTLRTKNPANWTPLMSLCDLTRPKTDSVEFEKKQIAIADMLLDHMTPTALKTQSATDHTFMHSIATRGYDYLVPMVSEYFDKKNTDAVYATQDVKAYKTQNKNILV